MRLSAVGEARRAALRVALEREADARGVRRRAGRAVLVGGAVVGGVMLFIAAWSRPGPAGRKERADPTRSAGTGVGVAVSPGGGESDAGLGAEIGGGPGEMEWTLAGESGRGVRGFVTRYRPQSVSLVARASADGDVVHRIRTSGGGSVRRASDAELASGLRASGIAAGVVRTSEGVRIVADTDEPGGGAG